MTDFGRCQWVKLRRGGYDQCPAYAFSSGGLCQYHDREWREREIDRLGLDELAEEDTKPMGFDVRSMGFENNPDLPIPRDSLLPATPLISEIPDEQPLIPRATLDVMLSGRFPLLRVAEGQSWKVKPRVVETLSRVLTREGLASVDRWEDLIASVGRTATLYVMDHYGERYKVIDVVADPGGETGELILMHLGRRSRGGRRMHVDIWDAYGKMLPFVVYR